MEKWWQNRFIHRRDWILDHLDELALNVEETMVVLIIDFMNEHALPITHGVLANKLKKDSQVIDDILSDLTGKGYLSLDFKEGTIVFCIDGIFLDEKDKAISFDQSLFELYESEFARPLSQMELQRMADWLKAYNQKLIMYALREALTYDCKSFDYIERILIEWKKRGFRAEDYEEGKR